VGYVTFASEEEAAKFRLDDYFYYKKDNEHYLAVKSGDKIFRNNADLCLEFI